MKQGLISKLVLPAVLSGLAGLTGCANTTTSKSPMIDEMKRAIDREIAKPSNSSEEDLKKSAYAIYLKCRLVVGEENIDKYDALVWAMAYKRVNNPNDKQLEDALLGFFKKPEIKNQKAYEECLRAAEVISRNKWRDVEYIGPWSDFKDLYEVMIVEKPEEFYSIEGNKGPVFLLPIGEMPVETKGTKKYLVFCKGYLLTKSPELSKEPVWELKVSPGKD